MWDAKLVILDEPTAALGVSQTAMVLQLIQRLSQQGIAVLFISHNLNDVFAVADRVAVLRLGRMAEEGPLADYDAQAVGPAHHDREGRSTGPATGLVGGTARTGRLTG